MFLLSVTFLLGYLSISTASVSSGPQLLFPLSNTQYVYFIKTNISCGTLAPVEADSYWTLEGKLIVQVYDNYTKVRYSLGEIKTSIYSKNRGYQSYNIAEAAKYLKKPWEVDYLEDGNIDLLYVTPNEPLWATNMKRALSINFQLKKDIGTYYNAEPCLYESYVDCQVVYVSNGNTIRKYNALHILAENSGYISWMSVPMDYSKAAFLGSPVNVYTRPEYSGPLDNIGTADRVYELDDKIGLLSLDLKSVFQHRTRSHVLGVVTELSLNYDSNSKMEKIEKLDVEKTSKRYVSHGYTDPTNGIKSFTQDQLRNMTYDILLRIACKGIDADNIVKNASKIHNLDFVNLLKTMSQLDYAALSKLFEDMVLGTSYEIETSRNIFLEVLPHVRTNACALFIKHLIVEQKQKVEDSTILSLIRKLPFNVANHSQELLEELEVFTRLGLDFPQDIRHAGILSFATLVFKAAEVRRVKRDYFDNIIVKYFRMYNDCPQYIDRLVWLQGLSNIQYYTETYLWTVYNNNTHDRHERFWAVHGTIPVFAPTGFAPTWHILMDEKEHIQIRVAALHSFLSSKISPSELLSVHNYILNCNNQQLKRFWYTTVKSLENSKTYNGYRVASNYLSFLTNQVTNPDSKLWATSNYIVGTYSEESATGAMVQLMSVGDPNSALPAFVHLRVKTVSELMATSDIGIFIKMEGVASHMFKKLHAINTPDLDVEKLVEVLRKMKVQTVKPEKVHIEIVAKLHEKTVYVSHFNQTRFETWNGEDLLKSVEDFLRFGSHINQQMVYYPFQLDASIPTELGTPVRLQTALVSFSSIRGNLTAPSSHDLTLRNDLHIRYQGTAVTSLCTDGPLLQSEHIVRIQQSLVAHLPLNFDVSVLYRQFELKWPNPASRNVGMAMHARAQIAMDSIYSRDTYTINSVENKFPVQVDETGVIFDCDRPLSSSEVIEKLLATNTFSYEFLAKLRPSVFLLNGLLILSAPPSGSCGLMFGGKRPKSNDTMLKLTVQFEDLFYDPDNRLDLKMVHNILYSDNHENGEVYLNVTGGVSLESTSNNITLELDVTGHQPDAADPSMRTWKFCLQEQDIRHGRKDQDIITSPAPYEGHLMLSFASGNVSKTCPAEGSQFLFHYRGVPTNMSDTNLERYFEIKISGSKLPKLKFPNEYTFSTYPAISQILSNFDQDPLNITAVIQEKNGIASVTIDSGSKMQFKAENLAWLLDSWSNMQIMKRLGIYRECRLQDTMIQTLSGYIDRLPPLDCGESLALADCTETPRFAVLRTKSGGIKLYTGGNYVTIGLSGGSFKIDVNGDPVECHEGCVYPMNQSIYDFKITSLDDAVKVHSRLSGVLVYYKREEVVILVPHSYMATSCGECVHQHYYRRC